MRKPVILMLGKLPPPFMGPSIATEIILNSSLKDYCTLLHIDTKAYDDLNELGEWSIKKLKRNLSIYRNMFRMVKKHHPDIVWIPISQTTTGFIKDSVFIWIAGMYKCKTILHLRGSNFRNWIDHASGLTMWFVKITLKKCAGIIVLGEKLKHLFKPYFPEKNIYVVPNGADYIIPEVVKNNNTVKLLYLANLQSSKGIEDVLMAIDLIHSKVKDGYHLDVAGKWRREETKQHCLDIIERNGLNVSIHATAGSQRKMQLLAEADIFVFPPREPEGHPWVIVEALASGLPVISTDQGAITESVIHERNGFIVNAGKPAEIADRMMQLINNNDLRQRMGQESRIHYLDCFTEEKMVKRLVITFEDVLKN
jgi:glycosyltransferase involved in cell wall biosynthesis